MDPSDSNMDSWLNSLSERDRLRVFQMLSSYLSGTELKKVMERVKKGEPLLEIHRKMGLLRKYQVDLIRIKKMTE